MKLTPKEFKRKQRVTPEETMIKTLGPAKIPSPLNHAKFTSDDLKILNSPFNYNGKVPDGMFETAGPRKKIYFDPNKVKAGIVTCGGICPGLNDVIRAIVMGLYYTYDVKSIFGIRYGLQGFIPSYGHSLKDLTPKNVSDIHEEGGTILGSSRGPQDIDEVVDAMERMNLNMLFILGGDGTFRAAQKIATEIEKRNLKISIIGVPKTIDNDISFVQHCFGFDTAVEIATQAIRAAHVEALASRNGVGLVRLMGRHSGFIAATAALTQRDVNFVLIPEVAFDLEGETGFLRALENRLDRARHAVVVVAEGAGQEFFEHEELQKDASGNVKLNDIGVYLKEKIKDYYCKIKKDVTVKYIDPSYMVRSAPANKSDSRYCAYLGQNAVHAAMAGKTNMFVSKINDVHAFCPLELATRPRRQVDPEGILWLSVLESTGQCN